MKSKMFLFIAVLMTSAMTIVARENSTASVSEVRTSKPYHFIHIQGEMNVKLIQDETPGVTVKGSKYQVENTITMVVHDTLFVYQTNTSGKESKAFITINVENISLLEVNGKTNVDCSGLINADFLTIRAHNGAHVKLDVRALKVESKATGNSFINLSGIVDEQVKSTDGTGSINSVTLEVMHDKGTSAKVCGVC